MNFLKTEGENLMFHLSRREKDLLLDLIKMYPLVPPAHYQLSSADGANEANQQLLDEALGEHREEAKREVQTMLAEVNRFQTASSGCTLTLSAGELEALLQILNDIRVGSWLLLGSPDEKQGKRARLSLKTAKYFWAMDLAGHFQTALLAARQ